jgi:ABC-type antimicrobial peptide transport system permease subunit
LFTESILIALIGGLISLVIALVAVRFISARLFADLPGASMRLDYKVFGFALLCSLITGVLFGTIPAWLASRADVNPRQRARLNCRTISSPFATPADHW